MSTFVDIVVLSGSVYFLCKFGIWLVRVTREFLAENRSKKVKVQSMEEIIGDALDAENADDERKRGSASRLIHVRTNGKIKRNG